MALYAVSVLASLVGLVALILISTGTGGAAPFVMQIAVSAIYLNLTVYNIYMTHWKSSNEPVELQTAHALDFSQHAS